MRNSPMQQRRFTKEFEDEAVRLVLTSGRTQREIAGDLGIGLSTLVRWIGRSRDRRAVDPATAAQSDVTVELKRLRRENEILQQGRDILKKATAFFAWKDRPASRRHRDDMVLLAYVRSAFARSNGTYGSTRMTRELQDAGLLV